MKRKIILISSVLVSFLLLLKLSVTANAKTPKGLEDRGPLTRITFIHYRRAFAKPPWAGGGGNNTSSGVKCYGFLSKGAYWKTQEPYYVNPSGSGLTSSVVENAVNSGVDQWETYAGDVFGNESINTNASYNNGNLDGVNTVTFGPFSDSNVIAVTNVWGYFNGPIQTRELVEWDLLFNNSSDWTWGNADSNSNVMDVQNIATHEIGHGFGMADLYDSSCNQETMFGYSTEGETIKRDLNSGDIQGIQDLYN